MFRPIKGEVDLKPEMCVECGKRLRWEPFAMRRTKPTERGGAGRQMCLLWPEKAACVRNPSPQQEIQRFLDFPETFFLIVVAYVVAYGR
jgi:hypothetical protein